MADTGFIFNPGEVFGKDVLEHSKKLDELEERIDLAKTFVAADVMVESQRAHELEELAAKLDEVSELLMKGYATKDLAETLRDWYMTVDVDKYLGRPVG